MDTPPLAIVHDTAILSRLVDGVVFVVNSRRIDHELLRRSGAMLEGAGANVVGALLNQVEPLGVHKKNAYYYRYRTNGTAAQA
jgi:Mrp family chromosome partitioning ATPase